MLRSLKLRKKTKPEKSMGCKGSKQNNDGDISPPSKKMADQGPDRGPSNVYHPNPTNPNSNKGQDQVISKPSTTEYDDRNLYKALYDYEQRTDGDVPFNKDDILHVTDFSDIGWWYAKNLSTQQEGYIPSNYVSRVKSILAEDWYFGAILRNESFKLLSEPGLEEGTFLVRDSVTVTGVYVISVRTSKVHEPVKVVNIRVHPLKDSDGGIQYYREENRKFDTVQNLIAHYSEHYADKGNKCLLRSSPARQAPQTNGLTPDEWEIARDAITLDTKLGEGNFGEVWKGTWKNKLQVAVKSMKPKSMKVEDFLEEAKTLKQLQHEHLLALQGVCTLGEPILIVTEIMVNGDLLKYLREKEGRYINHGDMIFMAKQIVSGMTFLEKRNFVHRDLAARNILVGENHHVKVADFGLSRVLDEEIYSATGNKFPVKWTAPEALLERKFSTKSDVWSFGITLTEIETKGIMPYPGMANRDLANQLERGYRMQQGRDCPDRLYGIMRNCWEWKPEDRPTFESLLADFSEYLIDMEKGKYD
ncbi:hypothetical protein BSL78_03120 [Apostichopus japonicus]|uniref:Tyrosine-protein kinase n=1 Tax=Stichopus japonicus TaxID=307972 RepID=A0A2G8LIA4_STIJA|nr:hypothetical protein BSL78_03120 [Apostichopus japonicus]